MTSPMDKVFEAVEWQAVDWPEVPAEGLPYATHRGILRIMGAELECFILSDGSRIFTAESLARFFGANE